MESCAGMVTYTVCIRLILRRIRVNGDILRGDFEGRGLRMFQRFLCIEEGTLLLVIMSCGFQKNYDT